MTETTIQEEQVTENFAALLEEHEEFLKNKRSEKTVTTGEIVSITKDDVLVDIGSKSEGRIPIKEFKRDIEKGELQVGDKVQVFLELYENRNGETILSREKAIREERWCTLEDMQEKGEYIDGSIYGRVKGGFIVELDGINAFLPGSQVDVRPVSDITPLIGLQQPFQILKMDKKRGNIVVSRRAILEESRKENREDLLNSIAEGDILEGIVKNITDYGGFVDLGGVDGLLHVTDISWKRINHPSEVLSLGQTVQVKVISFDKEHNRISLGMKQLEPNPWDGIDLMYPVGTKFTGKVTNITDYGIFVELESGIEGLVHISDMNWTKQNVHPSKLVSISQEVEVAVLEVVPEKHRISLGLKQCEENPWEIFSDKYKEGDTLDAEIRNITDFGIFVALGDEIDGLLHMADLSWEENGEELMKNYTPGDKVKVKILSIDIEKERIALGVKQLSDDPYGEIMKDIEKGKSVTCTVSDVKEMGIEVLIGEHIKSFIRKSDISSDKQEQRPERFAVGDRIDAKVMSVDKNSREVALSVKALEIEEQKRAIEEYGSADSGATLGDILGAALNEAGIKKDDK